MKTLICIVAIGYLAERYARRQALNKRLAETRSLTFMYITKSSRV
jgi:hypothetical protein